MARYATIDQQTLEMALVGYESENKESKLPSPRSNRYSGIVVRGFQKLQVMGQNRVHQKGER